MWGVGCCRYREVVARWCVAALHKVEWAAFTPWPRACVARSPTPTDPDYSLLGCRVPHGMGRCMIRPSNKAFAQRVYARAEGHLARRGALGWLPPSLPECPGLPGRTSPRRGPEPHGSPREAEGAPGKARESQGGPGRPRLRGQYRDAPDRLPLGGAAAAVAGGQMTRPQGSSAQPRGSSTAAHPRPRRGPSGPRTRAACPGSRSCPRAGRRGRRGMHTLGKRGGSRGPHSAANAGAAVSTRWEYVDIQARALHLHFWACLAPTVQSGVVPLWAGV